MTGPPRQTASPICLTIAAAEAEGLDAAAVEQRVWERHGVTCALLALDSSGMTRVSRHRGIVHFLAEDIAQDGDTLLTESAFAALTPPPPGAETHRENVSGVPVTYHRVRR